MTPIHYIGLLILVLIGGGVLWGLAPPSLHPIIKWGGGFFGLLVVAGLIESMRKK